MEEDASLKFFFDYIKSNTLALVLMLFLSLISGSILNNNMKSTYETTLDYINLSSSGEIQKQNPFTALFQSSSMGSGTTTKASFEYFIFSNETSDLLVENQIETVLSTFPQLKEQDSFRGFIKNIIGLSDKYSESDRLQRIIENNVAVTLIEDLGVYEIVLFSKATKINSEKFLDILVDTASDLSKKNMVSTLSSVISNTTTLIEQQNDLQIKDSLVSTLKADLKQLATYSSDELPAINILSPAKANPVAVSPNLNTYILNVILSFVFLLLGHLIFLRFKSV